MNKKQPERFDVSLIHDAVRQDETLTEDFYFTDDFAVLHGHRAQVGLFRFLLNRATPFLINDFRMGVLLKGEAHVSLNLIERHFTAGTIVFFAPGSIIEPRSISPDAEIIGLGLFGELPFSVGRLPALFNGSVRDFHLMLNEEQLSVVSHIIDALWAAVHTHPFSRETFDALSAALMQYYNHLHNQVEERSGSPSHDADIFNRFIELVNTHARREHKLCYYATRMCLTQRYLGSVVRKVSGFTAKEWIDRALVTEAKVMLVHSDKPVAQIAEELLFPSATFFSKYFRRLTGQTPADYRLMLSQRR